MILRILIGASLASGFSMAQQPPIQPPPLALAKLIEGIEDPDLTGVLPDIMGAVQLRGIDFDLGKEQLGAILAAGNRGRRDPAEMAAFIVTCWNVCQKCHERFVAPMSLDELLTILRRGHDDEALLEEVKARHVKDLDISEATANVLRAAGANEALVDLLVPDDKVPTIPLIGYNTLELKHAEDYDPSATAGWLKVTTELPANSTDEFVFKHNSLFGRAVTGGEPTNVAAYFNKPTPRNTGIEFVDFSWDLEGGEVCGSDEKRSGGFLGIGRSKPKEEKPLIEVAYLGGYDDGRNSFQIRLTNKQGSPQQYSFTVRWRVLAAAKPPDRDPKKSTPGSKK